MKRMASFVVAGILLLWSFGVRAGSLEVYGASSRGTAMGGAMIAISNGWDSIHYNPSALALSAKSTSVQVSYLSGKLMQNTDDSLNDGLMFKLGMNTRFLRNRLGVGLIVGTSSQGFDLGGLTDVGSLLGGGGPPNWNWMRYQDSLPVVLEVGFGFRIADWLSVGFSLNQKDSLVSMGFYPLTIDPILESLLGLSTGAMPSNVRGMGFDAGGDPLDDYATGFNVSFRPIKYISLGYVYKPEAWSRYKLRVELVGGPGSLLGDSQYIVIDMKVPGQVETTVYGAAGHIPIPWNDGLLTLAWQHETQNWDGFYPQSAQYQWDANDIFTQEWFSEQLTRDPGLDDVSFDRYGVEYVGDASFMMFGPLAKISNPRFAVRGGYYHWNSPQPKIRYGWQLAMMDADADVYSFGCGFGFDRKNTRAALENPLYVRRVEVDLHVQLTQFEDRTYRTAEDQWGNKSLQNYYVKSEDNNIVNIGLQVTWIN